jgi:TonB family protein
MNHPMFQSIDIKGNRWSRWAAGLAINAAGVSALIIMPVSVYRDLEPAQKVSTIALIDPPPVSIYKPVTPRSHISSHYRRRPVRAPRQAKAQPHAFEAPFVKPAEAKAVKFLSAPREISVLVDVAKLEAPKIELPLYQAPPVAMKPGPSKVVKTGGYDDPNGVPVATTASNRGSMLQRVGAFDMSGGSGTAARNGYRTGAGVPGSAGFLDGTGAIADVSAGGKPHGPIRSAGFGENDTTARSAPVARAAAVIQTPVEITWKPNPRYTAEAREKKIEGAVQFEVLFSSAGQIQVLRLLHGIGYGLDEIARQAASQIRFHPSTRNGTPVDVTGTVHIVFQLS